MATSHDLKALAKKLQKDADSVLERAESVDPAIFNHAVDAIAKAAVALEQASEQLEGQEPGITLETLETLASLADAMDESGDKFLMKKASVLDDLLFTICKPGSVVRQASMEDELTRLREKAHTERREHLYEDVRKELDTLAQKKQISDAVKDQVKAFRPLEAPLLTRTCPDHPGAQMARITDQVYQCSLDKKVYNYLVGYTTEKGNKIPGGSVENQTAYFGTRHVSYSPFDTRESSLSRFASVKTAASATTADGDFDIFEDGNMVFLQTRNQKTARFFNELGLDYDHEYEGAGAYYVMASEFPGILAICKEHGYKPTEKLEFDGKLHLAENGGITLICFSNKLIRFVQDNLVMPGLLKRVVENVYVKNDAGPTMVKKYIEILNKNGFDIEVIDDTEKEEVSKNCGCENENCSHNGGGEFKVCSNKAEDDKKIEFIGAVCGTCYEEYPAKYRLKSENSGGAKKPPAKYSDEWDEQQRNEVYETHKDEFIARPKDSSNDKMIFIMVYGDWGSEPYGTAPNMEAAKEKAQKASEKDAENEYVIELEPGGDAYIYVAGKLVQSPNGDLNSANDYSLENEGDLVLITPKTQGLKDYLQLQLHMDFDPKSGGFYVLQDELKELLEVLKYEEFKNIDSNNAPALSKPKVELDNVNKFLHVTIPANTPNEKREEIIKDLQSTYGDLYNIIFKEASVKNASKKFSFDLTDEEIDALAWLSERYDSADILFMDWDGDSKEISEQSVLDAFKATAGDGGNLGVVPSAGPELMGKINRLWDAADAWMKYDTEYSLSDYEDEPESFEDEGDSLFEANDGNLE